MVDTPNIPPIDEHHQGRGTTVVELRGIPLSVETGEDWFRRQPADRQQRIIANNFSRKQATEPDGLLAQLRSGEVQMSQLVSEYQSEAYGRMIRQATLGEIRARGLASIEMPLGDKLRRMNTKEQRAINKQAANFKESLTRDELQAVHDYTTQPGYSRMNGYLQGWRRPEGIVGERVKEEVATLSGAIKKWDGDVPTAVWRGLRGQQAIALKAEFDAMKPGETWKSRAFQSTSVDPSIAWKFAGYGGGPVMEIAPKNGAYIGRRGLSNAVFEREWLMDKDTELVYVGDKEVEITTIDDFGQKGRDTITVHQFVEK